MRKIFVFTLIILALIAAGASIWVLFSNTEEKVADTLFDAIPPDAGWIVDIRDYGELCRSLRENGLWNTLSGISSIKTLNDEMMLFDSIVQKYEPTMPFRNNVIFSFHPVGNEEMKSIGFVKINNDREARSLTELIKEQLNAKAAVTQRTYDNVTITEVAFNDMKQKNLNFTCAFRSGIFIFSRSSILLEYAIRQIASDVSITGNERLAHLIRSAGKNAPANLYVNYSQLPRTTQTVFHARLRKHLEPLTRFADWTELDLNIKPGLLLFNGFTECSNGSEQWLNILLSQPALPTALVDAMPSTAYAFLWMGIRHLQQYFSDYARYLELNKETDRKKELDRIRISYQIDLQNDFSERFEDEAALVYANVGQTKSGNEPFALFRVKSALSAVDMMEEWHHALNKRNVGSAVKKLIVIDKQLTFTAYSLPFDVPSILFGDIFAGGNKWCVVADNYLLFGNSPENLQRYLHYTTLHASLQTDVTYRNLHHLFSSRSNLTFFCNPALINDILENTLKTDPYREIQQASDVLSQMQAVVYQVNSASGKLYNNLFLNGKTLNETANSAKAATIAAGMQTSWESLLDTCIAFKPHPVLNHSTRETDIFVQDMANNAYLLNNVGRILWKVKLPEPIISPVYQLDIYRNGKLQMLFNTKSYIYVIDRLGNFVHPFPLSLKSPAAGSLSLFDYDGNRQYRMMIACEDRKVYVYDGSGKPVDGWNFSQSEHPLQTGIYHFRTGNKDYIVFADKYRVYILDRQGRTRVSPENNLPVARRTTIALDQQRSGILLTDTAGTVHFISLNDGKMSQLRIKPFPSSHFFVYQDADGDKQAHFIFASGNRLEVFRKDAKQIIDVETQEPIDVRPSVYEFAGNDLRIGIVQPKNNQIWLYDSKGKTCPGFPLKGSTPFSIGRLNKSGADFNLFVGSANGFLYNYPVR